MNLVHAIDGGIMKNAVFPVRAVNDLAGDFILCVVEPVNLLCGGVRAEHFLRQKGRVLFFCGRQDQQGIRRDEAQKFPCCREFQGVGQRFAPAVVVCHIGFHGADGNNGDGCLDALIKC